MFADMVEELELPKGQLAEAQFDVCRSALRNRFAKATGAISATFGRVVEQAKKHADIPGAWTDLLFKNFKHIKTMEEIVDRLDRLGGRPPGA